MSLATMHKNLKEFFSVQMSVCMSIRSNRSGIGPKKALIGKNGWKNTQEYGSYEHGVVSGALCGQVFEWDWCCVCAVHVADCAAELVRA